MTEYFGLELGVGFSNNTGNYIVLNLYVFPEQQNVPNLTAVGGGRGFTSDPTGS